MISLSAAAVIFVSAATFATAQTGGKDAVRQGGAGRPVNASLRLNPIVAEFDLLAEGADEIFQLALNGKMERVPKKFEALKKSTSSFPSVTDDSGTLLLPRLNRTMADLELAVNAKDRLDTMRYANRLTLIAATVQVPYKPPTPTEVLVLDYNARELEIWSELRRSEKLSNIVIRMHLAWQTLMPKLLDHNASRELKRFSELMGRLEVAKVPEEYAKVSRQILVELAAIRQVFTRPAK
ncbi:hypothetical protein L4X63_10095 [Geomonas sp. Red32]|uniref:hypothetical protein n=1 Tax=Geomonas sp. Red32 TaxID=2912856 RepID=UPI00202CAE00|nr:hypothetical protein [Geomonas sp. Red32]MCM0081941.1 hypothetical protein [Geomonas sp. Red32]